MFLSKAGLVIYKRSDRSLSSRGGGVVLQPDVVEAFNMAVVQAILNLGVPNMIFDRVALLGDAAFIPRPHTAASVFKAAANAIALADALVDSKHNVLEALKAWELEQLALGMHLWKRGQDLGETSQFVFGKERWQPSK